jgi:hypothetical protein
MRRTIKLWEVYVTRFEDALDRHRQGRLSADEAGEALGMSGRQFRRLRVRFAAEGAEGLRDAPRSGRPAVLSAEQMAELKALVLAGPDLAKDEGWRGALALPGPAFGDRDAVPGRDARADGRQAVAPPGADAPAAAALPPEAGPRGAGGVEKNFAERVAEVLPPTATGKPIEIWFQG